MNIIGRFTNRPYGVIVDNSILIVGTGALATLFAARCSAAGMRVSMLGTWKEGLEALNRNGACVEGSTPQRVFATANPEELGEIRYALVLVKAWQTERAARQLRECLSETGLAVTLQNGLGNDEVLADVLGESRVGRGITTYGATLLEPGRVRLGGEGRIILEECAELDALVERLRSAGLDVETEADIRARIWGKLVINSAINPLTALLGVRNGDLLEIASAREIMNKLAKETAAVAAAEGVCLPFDEPGLAAEAAASRSDNNLSSMLQDVRRGARTEVEAINGAIVRLGERHDVAVPWNRAMSGLVSALTERGKINSINTGNVKEE